VPPESEVSGTDRSGAAEPGSPWVGRVDAWLLAALTVGLAASITLSEFALAILALWLTVTRRWPGVRGGGWPLAAPMTAFAAWTLVAAVASARPLESLVAAKSVLSLGAFYVVLNALPDRAAAHRFTAGLLLAFAAVGALAVVQAVGCPGPEATGLLFRKCLRARGLFSTYMTLAGTLTLVLVATLPPLTCAGRGAWWKWPAWIVGVLALGLTYVRGAWLGFAVGALMDTVGGRRRRLALAAVAVVVIAAVVTPGVVRRLGTIGDLADPTTRERLAMLSAGLAMAHDHPLTGVGPGQVKHLYPRYAPPEAVRRHTSHLHDTPLQILVERGLPGLAAWLAIFAAFIVRGLRAGRRAPGDRPEDRALVLGCVAALVAFVVAGLFEYNFGDTEVLLVAAALMAVPLVIERDRRPS